MYFTETFLSFIEEDNDDLVKLVLDDCCLYHAADANGATLLHHATEYGNIEIIQYLLNKGSNIDAQDSEGRTPLMLAIREYDDATVQMLLAAGANIEIKDAFKINVLDIAFDAYPEQKILLPLFSVLKKKYSREEIAKMFADYGRGVDVALYIKDASIIEYMIQCGVSIQCCMVNCRYPLHHSVNCGDVQTVKVLLKYGAEIDALTQDGVAPLYYLYLLDYEHNNEKLDILKIFLDAGASLTSCTNQGDFQIKSTLILGSDKAVGLLLESYIDYTAKDDDGGTILHWLTQNNNPGIVDVLRTHMHKFDINATDDRRYKPLHKAVIKGNVDMVKFLLNQGAEATTALFYAYCSFKKELAHLLDECTELLFQYHADPQMVFHGMRGQQYTIFDIALDEKYFDRMKLALAELAVREKRGVPITTLTYSKINAHSPFKNYFEECQELLRKEIVGSISIFGLVTADEEKMAKYLNNGELVRQLRRLIHGEELTLVSRYYGNILKKRVSNGVIKRKLKNKAARIVRNISGNRLSLRDIATERIINYLNHKDLHQLYQV